MSPYKEWYFGPCEETGDEEPGDGAGLPLGEVCIFVGLVLAVIVSVALILWGSP